jgi:tetratricopeptide (TPR) repeat protein
MGLGLCGSAERKHQEQLIKTIVTSRTSFNPLSIMKTETLELQSDDQEAWYSQGTVLANLGRYEEALASVDQALAKQPGNHKAWIFRGTVLTDMERYKAAITSFDQALKIQPNDKTAWLFRGVALHHLGDYKQAYASYDIVLETQRQRVWQKRIQMLKDFLNIKRFIARILDREISRRTDNSVPLQLKART